MRVCHCSSSTARNGHIHEDNGYILCLHYEGESAPHCPAITINDALEDKEYLEELKAIRLSIVREVSKHNKKSRGMGG